MKTLHIACMPFPAAQGTQAAVRAMVEAEGHDATLLTYGEGAFPIEPGFAWARARRMPGPVSTRSGPSVRKVAADVLVLARARELASDRLIVAHHVEAAGIAFALGAPFVYLAHTALEPELPAYGTGAFAPLLARIGALADRAIVARAPVSGAVSPMLAARLSAIRPVEYVPVPWPLAARAEPPGTRVVAYVGNLDRYQGWEDAVEAVSTIDATLLVATQSPVGALVRHADRHRVRLEIARLATEADRRRVYARADVVVVPRRLEGGVPVKLLDALARGAAVVTTERARAGLAIDGAARVVADDAPAMALAIDELLEAPAERRHLGEAGRAFIEAEHSRMKFVDALSSLAARLRSTEALSRP
jgi:glycosyltransferase involved in cell wall biosynthesis